MTYWKTLLTSLVTCAVYVVAAGAISGGVLAQASREPRYQTRTSDCRHEPPPGAVLSIRRAGCWGQSFGGIKYGTSDYWP